MEAFTCLLGSLKDSFLISASHTVWTSPDIYSGTSKIWVARSYIARSRYFYKSPSRLIRLNICKVILLKRSLPLNTASIQAPLHTHISSLSYFTLRNCSVSCRTYGRMFTRIKFLHLPFLVFHRYSIFRREFPSPSTSRNIHSLRCYC